MRVAAMETGAVQLEAKADLDVPPRSWAEIVSAAARLANQLFPQGTVALIVGGDGLLRRLNREHRRMDQATDVLSFPAGPGARHGHLGDIAVSWDAVERQAQANGNSVEAEAAALLAHALLHLAGYDHPDPVAQDRMDARTRELCQRIGYKVVNFGH